MIAKGQGTKRDTRRGLEWIEAAAERGCSTAQLNIGLAFRWAYDKPQDYEKAFAWFLKAAENPEEPDGDAMAWVSQSYRLGLGIAQDMTKADEWAVRAKAAGSDPENPVNFWAIQ